MSTRPIRVRFLHRLAREVGAEHVRRVPHDGSRSMIAIGTQAAVLIRAGRLDRERRLFTHLRRTDIRELERQRRAAVCILIPELGEPLVVPVSELVAHAAPAADPVRLHIRVGARGQVMLAETGRDLRRFAGWERLRRLSASGGRTSATPRHSHGQWITVVGAMGMHAGYRVYIPRADHASLDPRLARGSGLIGACDDLPAGAVMIDSLRYADVVYSRPGAEWPEVIWEVERAGDITAALRRSAETLEELRRRGASALPRFVIVACPTRRTEFDRKLKNALYMRAGLSDRCTFQPFSKVWTDFQSIRRGKRSPQRL